MEYAIPNSAAVAVVVGGGGVWPSGWWCRGRGFVVSCGTWREIGFEYMDGEYDAKANGRGVQPYDGAGNAEAGAEDGVLGDHPGTATCTYRQRWTLRLHTGGWVGDLLFIRL